MFRDEAARRLDETGELPTGIGMRSTPAPARGPQGPARGLGIFALLSAATLFPPATNAAGPEDRLRLEAADKFGRLVAAASGAASAPAAELGRELFWDARLSADGRTACASCHHAADGGGDRRRFSPDARGRLTARNAQTVFNALLQPALRWTADRDSGAHQAEKSITGSMGFDQADAILSRLRQAGYAPKFRRAFPHEKDPLTPTHYARALASYQATLITPAPFDRYLAGQEDALDEKQRFGLKTFLAVGCADCHDGPLLGGKGLRTFGVTMDYWLATGSEKKDAGRHETTRDEADRYKFRVSMLRNIATTAPYFHDGSVADLGAAVQVMADVQLGGRLNAPEAEAIVAFLRSLTGPVPPHYSAPPAVPAAPRP